jgi:hypothetical protein
MRQGLPCAHGEGVSRGEHIADLVNQPRTFTPKGEPVVFRTVDGGVVDKGVQRLCEHAAECFVETSLSALGDTCTGRHKPRFVPRQWSIQAE